MLQTLRMLCFLLVAMVALPSLAQRAQPPAAGSENAAAPASTEQLTPAGGDAGTEPFNFKRILTRFEFWLSLLILAFGAIVVFLQFFLMRRQKFDANDLLKVFGVTLIVVGTLFLIAAGFGDKQIAPAMGLFGTLAGYLLGKASVTPESPQASKPTEGQRNE